MVPLKAHLNQCCRIMDAQRLGDMFPLVDISYVVETCTSTTDWSGRQFQEDPKVQDLVSRISYGFGQWGFLYIKGHGIPRDVIALAFEGAREFFSADTSIKSALRRDTGISLGFVSYDAEVFDYDKPRDIKEALDYLPRSELAIKLSSFSPKTVTATTRLFDCCRDLLDRLLRLIAMALGMNDTEHFVNLHHNIGDHSKNGSTMRLLFYPEMKAGRGVAPDQLRCGEHTDYGTMTLLFQDSVGGLEIMSPYGMYVKAVPIPDTIVINAGDLLHTWSKGKFKATLHRVVPVGDDDSFSAARQSIAFFTHPDYSVNIEYTDDRGEVQKRNAHDHLKAMFDRTIAKAAY